MSAQTGSGAGPSFREALAVWARIGVLSFGGPAAQTALMHRVLVEEKRWISQERYLAALGFCMLLPGPEAMQLATYAGWRLHGVAGGLAAGLLFIAPGALIVLGLSALYAAAADLPLVAAALLGAKAAVLAIVVEALLRLARRALLRPLDLALALAAGVALTATPAPYPLVVALAAAIGAAVPPVGAPPPAPPAADWRADLVGSARTAAAWLALWLLPLAALQLAGADLLASVGWFFAKLAVVTFGGAYAVLAAMGREAAAFGWLTPEQMIDGLGLAETTPGPLILVTQFVGFLAGLQSTGGGWLSALAGAATALWATFVPCFLWIFAGAPHLERITAQPRLRGALAGVTAAVVGVVASLAIWFAQHTLFAQRTLLRLDPLALELELPRLASLDAVALLLSALSFWVLLGRKRSALETLAVAALAGAALETLW